MSALPTEETCVSAHSPLHHFTFWFLEIPSRTFFTASCFPLRESDPPTLVLYQLLPPVTDFTCPHQAFEFFCSALFVSMKFLEPWCSVVSPLLLAFSSSAAPYPEFHALIVGFGWRLFLGACYITESFWLTPLFLHAQINQGLLRAALLS